MRLVHQRRYERHLNRFGAGDAAEPAGGHSGSTTRFDNAQFCGGTIHLADAQFSGGTISFNRAQFAGGTVDFSARWV
ncbi:hypothetical protein GCM10010094_80260 [Streptomyces flaveus]|uniref:Pentapeptide repeat protein n=1 Tax=Streptomyces flaveus TaxID=66370 RepID=A0A917RH44_9ACTN|nr:hypothetical protein GCM10010094_80260 [Streptomyces flaveus]